MSFNIPFNTIIYIMVFILPGLLFRRGFFSGEIRRGFEFGNGVERLFWNILTSLVMLATYSVFVSYLNGIYSIETKIQFSDLIDLFVCIYENKLPTVFFAKENISELSKLLWQIYFFSLIIGWFCNKTLFLANLDKKFKGLQFQNRWYLITNSMNQTNRSHSIGDHYFTKIDVKNAKNELFSGELHDIVFDNEGKFAAIIIKDAYKFYELNKEKDEAKINIIKSEINSSKDPKIIVHSDNIETFKYKKRIKGDLFSILNYEIENISITYIKISTLKNNIRIIGRKLLAFSYLLAIMFCIVYLIWDLKIFDFDSIYKRIFFCVSSIFILTALLPLGLSLTNFENLKNDRKKYWFEVVWNAAFVLIVGFPLTYSFGLISLKVFPVLYLIFAILLIKLANWLSNRSPKKN